MKYKLNKTADQVLELVKESVRYARNLGAQNIMFACENARKLTFGSGDSSLQLVKLSFNRVSGVVPTTIGVFNHINSLTLLPAESLCREWTLRL
ncbi:hypothetical protein ACFX2I_029496 [Malus domestica]